MERKTKVSAAPGKQDLMITREFDLSVDLLFKAYTEKELLEQWMGTTVMKLENHPHGGYRFVTTDPKGQQHGFNGVIHEFVPESRITRTFEMEGSPFPVQLEFLSFESLTDQTSRLTMHIVFKSMADRDQLLLLPFSAGINMAHDRLQAIFHTTK